MLRGLAMIAVMLHFPTALNDRISALSADQLEALARCFADTARVALLNFNSMDDLSQWLEANA
jgi:Domain of unknown function (DUF4351)